MIRNHLAGALARAALLTVVLGLAAGQARAYPGMDKKPAAAPQGHPTVSGTKFVYDCPRPGCVFESSGPGTCPHHGLKLAKMSTMYTCPTDNQPVAGPGKCPRCPMDAKPHKLSAEVAKSAAPAAKKPAPKARPANAT
ncbi:MAG: hypothetical protein HZB25_07215 [Candidatus Eisenbacteria bacterium]|nr:hypothetical protein [Candidatus Eisenbacteria bacterium]